MGEGSGISTSIDKLGTILFTLAVLHTFVASQILKFSKRFKAGSPRQLIFHWLGEIETVFGTWGLLFFLIWSVFEGPKAVLSYASTIKLTEPIFVFCVMVIASSKPILWLAQELLVSMSSVISTSFKLPLVLTEFFVVLTVGSLVGSLITEPAAMTVTALLLFFLLGKAPTRLLYLSLAVLFVNVSIGGALTHFAAPPILMVAKKWNWDLAFVFEHFGWKCIFAVVVNSLLLVAFERKSIQKNCQPLRTTLSRESMPIGLVITHVFFLIGTVLAAHYSFVCLAIFTLFFLFTKFSAKFQSRLRVKESLLVAFFLAGIILFGPFQKWWLQPILQSLNEIPLFFSAVLLTSFTDNAALTYLGSQVEGLSDLSKYYLVAGAIAGGGLTVIANAPNAAGLSVLQDKFKDGFNPLYLFVAALVPTVVAILALEFFPI
jgi:hypothetical protein